MDLLGTALVLEELGRVIAAGGAGVVISSMAGHMFPPFAPEQEHALAHTPTDELLDLPFLNAESMGQAAYGYAKRANHLRVQSASLTWGERGARVNAISPGIIITPLAQEEMSGPGAAAYRKMIETSAAERVGHAGRGRGRRRLPARPRGRLHHRQRPAHGRRRHRRPARRALGIRGLEPCTPSASAPQA